MRDKFQKFNEAIAGVTSPAVSIFGTGLPGMVGASAQQEGVLNSTSEAVRTLRRQTAELNQEFTHKPDRVRVKELADAIEGSLLGLQSFSILDEKHADDIIDQLHDLVSDAK